MVENEPERRRKLIVVANRGPVSYAAVADGERIVRRGGGGLVTALRSLVARHEVTWIASAMSDEDRVVAGEHGGDAADETARDGSRYRIRLVAADPSAYDWYYNVVANPTLWFLQHYMWGLPYAPDLDLGLHNAWFNGYLPVNQAFADATVAELERDPAASVFFHDYHLYLAPKLVRARETRRADGALRPHPVAAVRLLARAAGASAARGARRPARERRRRLPHRAVEAELPALLRGHSRRRRRHRRRRRSRTTAARRS